MISKCAVFGNVYANIRLQCCIYKKVFKNSIEMLECSIRVLTVLLKSIDLFDTVDDITQKKFGGAPPPSFRGALAFLAFLSAHNLQ